MRRLALLALVALAVAPLSAHDHYWRRPRRVIVVEGSCRPYDRGEYRHWDEDRWERRDYDRRYSRRYECDDDRVILRPLPRPLAPPFQGRVEFWIH
jgi:hypothetical protein